MTIKIPFSLSLCNINLQVELVENLKEKESLDLQISTYAEFIKVKQGEERPILNEKKLTLQIIDDIEASMTRQHRECKILIREKLATEEDTRKLEYNLEDLRDRIEINKLTIKSKEEMIELNQPLIPNITCNTRFFVVKVSDRHKVGEWIVNYRR